MSPLELEQQIRALRRKAMREGNNELADICGVALASPKDTYAYRVGDAQRRMTRAEARATCERLFEG